MNPRRMISKNFDIVSFFEDTIEEYKKTIVYELTSKYGEVCKKCDGKTHKEVIGSHMERDSGWDESGSPSAYSHEVSDEGDVPDSCDNCIEGKETYILGSRRDLEIEWFKSYVLRQFNYEFYFFTKNRKRDMEEALKNIDKQLLQN